MFHLPCLPRLLWICVSVNVTSIEKALACDREGSIKEIESATSLEPSLASPCPAPYWLLLYWKCRITKWREESLKGIEIGLKKKIFKVCIALQGKSRMYDFSQWMVTSVAIKTISGNVGRRSRWWCRDGGVLKFRTTNRDDVSIEAVHRLHQDNSYNVMVAVVGCVGLDFSIFLNFLGLAKMGLVQDSCKCDMYSGVGILPL